MALLNQPVFAVVHGKDTRIVDRFQQWYGNNVRMLGIPDTWESGAVVDVLVRGTPKLAGVFDLSLYASRTGLFEGLSSKIRTFGPNMRAGLLETVRSVGAIVAEESWNYHEVEVPPSLSLREYDPENWRAVIARHGSHVVVKQEQGLAMDRVRFAQTIEQVQYLMETMPYPLVVQTWFPHDLEIAFYVAVVGKTAELVPLGTLFEHKRALTGDLGPLTSEMGTVVKAGLSDRAMMLMQKLRPALQERRYTGLLEANFLYRNGRLTFTEFTCRQSEPGWEILLNMADQTNLAATFSLWLHGTPVGFPLQAMPWAVGVCIAGGGYPRPNGCPQNLPMLFESVPGWATVVPFAARQDRENRWRTYGGRHALVIGYGETLEAAHSGAYHPQVINSVRFFGRQYRLDIGTKVLHFEQQLRSEGWL